MQENVLMWLFATTVVFLSTLQLSALRRPCAGTARNLATQQASAPMKAYATRDKVGHLARDCPTPEPGDLRNCNNCYKQGHIAADCTNENACNNYKKTGILLVTFKTSLCATSATSLVMWRGSAPSLMSSVKEVRGITMVLVAVVDFVISCRNCNEVCHMSRECMRHLMNCHNCGGHGHAAYECPSGKVKDRMHHPRRY